MIDNDNGKCPVWAIAGGWAWFMSELEVHGEYGLMTVYLNAEVLHWDNTDLVIRFPSGSLTGEIAADPEKITRLESQLKRVTMNRRAARITVLGNGYKV